MSQSKQTKVARLAGIARVQAWRLDLSGAKMTLARLRLARCPGEKKALIAAWRDS